jgi:hypothetical protein
MFIILTIVIGLIVPTELIVLVIIDVGIVSFLSLIFLNYRGIKITITKDEISVRYGVFNNKKIKVNKIKSCEITRAYPTKYGGVGVRLGVDGSWAYNTDFGEAVKIEYEDGRPFVFSSRSSNKICEIIKELKI